MNKTQRLISLIERSKSSKLDIAVDEHLFCLIPSLQDVGFKVYSVPHQTPDHTIGLQLEGDVVLTKDMDVFRRLAVKYDYDIINIKNIKFLDDAKTNNITTNKIETAIRESEFYNKKGNWLLTVFDDGSWKLTEMK